MKKFKRVLQSLGFVFTSFMAALGAPSDPNVQSQPIPGGVDVVGGGDNFVIQGDIQDPPAPMPAVTLPLESHFSPPPPPKIFTPPPPPPKYD